jgi:hypothetical protein
MGVDRRVDAGRSRVEDALELAALQAAREAARKTARRAAGGYFMLLFTLLVGAAYYQHATNARLDRSELFACERVQLQRERANVSDARQYLLMVAIAEAPRASRSVREEYAGLARTARYDPPTECPAAVRRPNSYRRPASVPYCAADGRGCRVGSGVFARSVVRAAQEGRAQPEPEG